MIDNNPNDFDGDYDRCYCDSGDEYTGTCINCFFDNDKAAIDNYYNQENRIAYLLTLKQWDWEIE
jgi:hypothetical protein